ncbi:uncharacterized protein J3D65DRAFT_614919 [Phyllosticta citribraziliensis]|uniref:Uncharacterized protein n=1 Tax=Phyllosticta citribraziliensis TaxID=989973 RepID=A0ABR1M5A2_9PEZI
MPRSQASAPVTQTFVTAAPCAPVSSTLELTSTHPFALAATSTRFVSLCVPFNQRERRDWPGRILQKFFLPTARSTRILLSRVNCTTSFFLSSTAIDIGGLLRRQQVCRSNIFQPSWLAASPRYELLFSCRRLAGNLSQNGADFRDAQWQGGAASLVSRRAWRSSRPRDHHPWPLRLRYIGRRSAGGEYWRWWPLGRIVTDYSAPRSCGRLLFLP